MEWKNLNAGLPINKSGLNANLFEDDYSQVPKFERKKPEEKKPATPLKPKAGFKPVAQANIINQMNGESVELSAGKIVMHDRFGKGKVISLEGETDNVKATVLFDNAGEKKLLLNFAKLKVIS